MANTVFLPSYTIGGDAYKEINKICTPYGKKAVVIGGKTAISKAKQALVDAIQNTDLEIIDFVWYGGDSTYANINALAENPKFQEADMVFAVGGGRAIDTCKTLCDIKNKPVFSFPTIASNCSPVTAVCVIYDDETHAFKELYFPKKSPIHCFINTQIISEAPYTFIWAGIGDALSKQYEAGFSSRGDELDHTNGLGVQISKNCSTQLIKYGFDALNAVKNHKPNHALEQVVSIIIVSTGLVSVLVNNDYNSCLAHSIYYGCTMLKVCEEKHLHGELVSYGVLILLLMDKQEEEFKKVFNFNKSVNLPTCLKDIDINTEADLNTVLDKTMTTNDIVHVPYKITREMIYDAIMQLEQYNKEHK